MTIKTVNSNENASTVVSNLRDMHHGKWVNSLCATRGIEDLTDGLELLEQLHNEGIVEKRTIGAFPLYRFAFRFPSHETLKVVK